MKHPRHAFNESARSESECERAEERERERKRERERDWGRGTESGLNKTIKLFHKQHSLAKEQYCFYFSRDPCHFSLYWRYLPETRAETGAPFLSFL